MRPRTLDEVVGQAGALGPGSYLREAAREGRVPSLVLWGPPGSGKTTIAKALASTVGGPFVALSAVTSGVKDVRAVIEEAQAQRARGKTTLLFVDEIHRFNKAQQDAFLPHVEAGTVVLVGATTENPAFALTRALLSRLRVVVLVPLSTEALGAIVDRALADGERGLGGPFALDPDARSALLDLAEGDARRCLNALEGAADHAKSRGTAPRISVEDVRQGAQRRVADYDRGGDRAYDALSAFHKSLRGSDCDAALYWMARMLEGGEDPVVVARRMVAMAFEDVGLADAHAGRVALEAMQAVEMLGLPEAELALVKAAIHLATAPKSNAVLRALTAAHEAARAHPAEPVPVHLRNAPTSLAKSLGHGAEYRYPHDDPRGFEVQEYLPPALRGTRTYEPVEIGDEREVARRLAWWRERRAAKGDERRGEASR
jgi:putative ATPase